MSGLRYSKAPRWVCKAPFDGAILLMVAQHPSPKHWAIAVGLSPPWYFQLLHTPKSCQAMGWDFWRLLSEALCWEGLLLPPHLGFAGSRGKFEWKDQKKAPGDQSFGVSRD